MSTIFINSENCKTSHAHRLMLNLTDKIDLQKDDNCIGLSGLSLYYT